MAKATTSVAVVQAISSGALRERSPDRSAGEPARYLTEYPMTSALRKMPSAKVKASSA